VGLRTTAIEDHLADVGPVRQDAMNRGDTEARSGLRPIAARVEPLSKAFCAERAGLTIAVPIELEYQLDELPLDRVDLHALLDPRPFFSTSTAR
jgi:hypothetical protein